MVRCRADLLLVEQGLADTRAKAQAMILAGAVLADNDRRVEKPGEQIDDGIELRIKGEPLPFVSRAGGKLDAALEAFAIDVEDRVCLDVGASTGGFTDCLLGRGARRVYAVDVGYGQMAWSLRQDPRVRLIERTNIRHLKSSQVPESCTRVVVDVSFISLRTVLPATLAFAASRDTTFVCLVKPQFEVGRKNVGKGGVVRSDRERERALEEVRETLQSLGFVNLRSMESPLPGAKGNREILLAADR